LLPGEDPELSTFDPPGLEGLEIRVVQDSFIERLQLPTNAPNELLYLSFHDPFPNGEGIP
jgi:hypothetical protein